MTLQNPYEVPLSAVEAPPQSSGEIPDSLVHDMQVTRTWVRLLSILAFILTGLLMIGGVGVMIAGSFSKELPSWAGAIYLVFAAVYVPPALFLHRYASALTGFLSEQTVARLGVALAHQKSFWRFIGICAALLLILYGLAMAAVMVGAFAAFEARPASP